MKKGPILSLFVLLINHILLFSQNTSDSVFLTIDNETLTVSEFINQYQKGSKDVKLDTVNMNKFLQLFIDFRLKIIDAQNKGIDTTTNFKNELAQYSQEFRNNDELKNEYHDGILLFNHTNVNAWQKALDDSVGRRNFYENNKNKYAPKTYSEAGKIVIADYQKHLEKEWEKMLRQQYTVKINRSFLREYINAYLNGTKNEVLDVTKINFMINTTIKAVRYYTLNAFKNGGFGSIEISKDHPLVVNLIKPSITAIEVNESFIALGIFNGYRIGSFSSTSLKLNNVQAGMNLPGPNDEPVPLSSVNGYIQSGEFELIGSFAVNGNLIYFDGIRVIYEDNNGEGMVTQGSICYLDGLKYQYSNDSWIKNNN